MARRSKGQVTEAVKGKRYYLRIFVGREVGADGEPKGKYHRESFEGTERQAKVRLDELASNKGKGILVSATRMTVKEYLELWLREAVKGKKAGIRMSTTRICSSVMSTRH